MYVPLTFPKVSRINIHKKGFVSDQRLNLSFKVFLFIKKCSNSRSSSSLNPEALGGHWFESGGKSRKAMESEEVKQESLKAEPAMEIDFKSEVDNDDNYTFQHDLAKSCANIEANLGKSVMDEKEAIGPRDVASNLQQFKQELEEK